LTGSEDGCARLFEIASGRMLGNLMNAGTVMTIAFAEGGRTAVAAAAGNSVRVWELASWPVRHRLNVVGGRFPCFLLSPDGRTMLLGGGDGNLHFWDVNAGRMTGQMIAVGDAVRAAAWSGAGDAIATLGEKQNLITFWNARTGERLREWKPPRRAYWMTLISGGRELLVIYQGALLQRLHAYTFEVLEEVPLAGEVWNQALSEDEQTLLVLSNGGPARHYSLRSRELIRAWQRAEWDAVAAVSPDGTIAVLGSSGRHPAQLWDLTAGRATGPPLNHGTRGQNEVALSGDGRLAATAADRTVRIWDVATGKPIGPPIFCGDRLAAIRFSPDHRWFAVAGTTDVCFIDLPTPSESSVELIRQAIDGIMRAD
jgi:WD40 repeat protein